ncbi:hypothetical protein VTJ04DRAFT_2631 [Mycothermus thermophilus]|uniref:uncharacterized protein n=1 Tax=Humicola insolens TaxID=85995 RepID=UPI0037433125
MVGVLQRKGILGMVDNEDERSQQAQLVFVLIGQLTCFYWPSRYQVLRDLSVYTENRLDIPEILMQPITGDQLDVPLASLIRHFNRNQSPIPGMNNLSRRAHQTPSPRILEAANVFFHTLKHVAELRILWTSSSGEHLQLDLRNKVLRLFRLPSFCAMIIGQPLNQKAVWDSGKTDEQVPCPRGSYLSQIFKDLTDLDEHPQGNLDSEQIPLGSWDRSYHREILLTFRLIFGQDRASAISGSLARPALPLWFIPRWCYAFRRKPLFLNNPWHPGDPQRGPDTKDPLLPKLCGEDWQDVDLYYQLEPGPTKSAYVVDEEFPFFADRLMALQDFVQAQSPRDFWSLLNDRRDMNRLWTVRVAVVLGLVVAVLTVLQLLVGLAQLAVAIMDLKKGGD